MNRRLVLPVALIAFAGLMAGFASTAQAFPTKTTACTGCHDGSNVPITATLASTAGANATYNFSAPGADAVVVFDGATKIFTFTAATGSFTVATGKTYTLYSVTGPGTSDGLGSTTVSPVGAPLDLAAPSTTSDAKATYVSSAAIKLTANDLGSGVANTYYKLDGGAQVTGTSINVTALGAHTIEFWSVDVAGNIEAHKTASFTITAPVPVDSAAPVTTSDAKATYVSSAAIKLSATDAGSGVAGTYYKLDGGAQVTGTSINVTALGAHTIEFWSVDVAGNIEAHKTASFTITAPVPVDSAAPVTTSDAKATYVSTAAVKLTATDAMSGVAGTYYKLDGGAQVTGTSINVTALGAHTIEFWSVDVAGNIEAHKTASFTITAPVPVDSAAPVTTSDAKATYVSAAAVKLTATDAMSGVAGTYYKLDGGAQVTGTSINVTALGAHTIEFWSVDVAGNIEAHKTASFTITAPVPVDSAAPVTTSDAKATYVSAAAVKLTATDAMSGVAGTYYKLDGGAQVTGTSINVTALGAHTIEFWSVDVAGNIEAHKTASFTITAPVPVDSAAPVTTSDAKATYVSAAAVKLTATDAMSGVAGTYYKLDGGAQVTGTSINVTALGAHTIEFWSVDVAGNVEAHKTASFTITAPVPVDSAAPVTTSDAKATYVSSAAIKLSATDAGSGVAGTYYKLDGGAQVTGTSVSVTATGTHTIEFWSVDVAGNAEAHKTASLTITAPAPVPTPTKVYTVTTRVDNDSYGRTATLTNISTGAKFTARVGRTGSVTFTQVPAGTYRLTVRESRTRTIRVPLTTSARSDDDD